MEVADACEQRPVAAEFVDYVVERQHADDALRISGSPFAQAAIKGRKAANTAVYSGMQGNIVGDSIEATQSRQRPTLR
ncbi:hypothetical protein [Paraburkholderia sp.]|jgi:hypothetical protein|uniref:hypothetical protein n=1 Tax=Paraburkholderia sp. TaxID=1926495 RepID=UPI003C7D3963